MKSLARISLVVLLPAALLMAGEQKTASSAPPSKSTLAKHRRVRLGGIMVGAGYSRWSGSPYWGGYGWPGAWYSSWAYSPWGPWGFGYYDPWWYGFPMHPGYYTGFAYGPGMGEIKLSAPEDAEVYLDGAYAGRVEKLKSMWLEPGAYSLELRDDSGASYQKRIYILSGKTLSLRARLEKSAGKDVQP